jgi:hypothetical protein
LRLEDDSQCDSSAARRHDLERLSQAHMVERPPIPTELRRRVLVEAGHRCAIHTCRHVDVDVHHITPWERCREHTYDNLIALCPNCHRRADAGDIDRMALRTYKARLTSGVGSETPRETEEVPPSAWRLVRVTESRPDVPQYDVDIEIPAFAAPDLTELNQIEHGWALGCIQSFRRTAVSPTQYALPPEGGSELNRPEGYLSGAFTVMHFAETSLSFRYAMNEYHFGAMHPQAWFRTVTALRKPLVILRFEDLFDRTSDFLARVASFATTELLRSNDTLDPDWVRRGAGPELGNFAEFNVSEAGLLITFPPYQVASWADGPQEVTVPWPVMRGVLNSSVRTVI